ncbi:MAG: tetratricopeptide repeat protein [Methyloceanibacter sp.]
MSDRDFFREVDEAVRQDKYKKLWDQYGVYVLGAAAVLVVGVAGYQGWTFWQQKRAADSGAKFSEALRLEDGAEASKAREMLAALAESGPAGYSVLARFQLAAAEAKAGNTDKAVADFDTLAKDPGVDPILQDHAKLQAAALRLEKADYAEMEQRLKPLAESGSAWRFSARELMGLSAYRLKNMSEAEKQFNALIGDEATPQNLRERAEMMIALIVGAPQTLSSTAQ